MGSIRVSVVSPWLDLDRGLTAIGSHAHSRQNGLISLGSPVSAHREVQRVDLPNSVIRIARRHAKPGYELAYEALIGGMLEDTGNVPGFIRAELRPPQEPGGDYQTILQFESEQALETWNRSDERREWHQRIAAVAEDEPKYQYLSGLEAWFARPPIGSTKPPARWKMAIVTWIGI